MIITASAITEVNNNSADNNINDSYWMEMALGLARRAAAENEVPVGAVVVYAQRTPNALNAPIVGEGWNCPIARHDPTAHAEIIALRDAARQLQNYRLSGGGEGKGAGDGEDGGSIADSCDSSGGATLYVTLEPCIMCVGAMVQARVRRLVFGADDPKSGAVQSVFRLLDEMQAGKLNHKITYTGGVLAIECGELLQSFFRSRRRSQK